MPTKIDTVTARDTLKPRVSPYFHKIRSGEHLGFRKTAIGSSGTWIVRIQDNSKKYLSESLGSLDTYPAYSRFNEAVINANKWLEKRRGGLSPTSLTVSEAFSRYVEKHRIAGRKAAVKDLESRYRRWLEPDLQLAQTKLSDLTQCQIQKWRTKLATTPALLQDKARTGTAVLSPSSVNREMAVLKAALNLAVRDGLAGSDLAWKYQLLPIKNATQRRECYLDVNQRKKLIASAQPDLAIFINAMALLPLRPGAVASLKVSDFDKRLGLLKIRKDKSAQDRSIELPTKTVQFLAEQAKYKESFEPILSRANGKFWNKDSWKNPFKNAVKTAGLPLEVTAYALRHAVITDLISLHSLDTVTVAILSGTSLGMIEKHYGHLLRSKATAALANLDLS